MGENNSYESRATVEKSRWLVVSFPKTPGAVPSKVVVADLSEARALAATLSHRRDLNYQDVRIELPSGKRVEYAGPCR